MLALGQLMAINVKSDSYPHPPKLFSKNIGNSIKGEENIKFSYFNFHMNFSCKFSVYPIYVFSV